MKIGNKNFDLSKHTYVMGILNVTPDSFSDGGRYNHKDAALRHVQQMIQEGASIIDVGGESTRPGFAAVSEEEEMERTIPIVEAIHQNFDTVISIDTYKAATAKEAMSAGASLINDVWGFKKDPKMAEAAADTGAVCCLMHNRTNTDYQNFMVDVLEDLKESIELAKKAGVSDELIIVDPGVGFAKSQEQNLEVIREVAQLKTLGYPVLLATSRKSVIGNALNLPKEERMEGTLVTTVMGVLTGCGFIRVHDVAANVRAIQMTEAILGEKKNG